MEAAAQTGGRTAGGLAGGLIFLTLLAYYWLTLQPFADLGLASAADPWAGNSNLVNQAIAIALFAVLMSFSLRQGTVRELLQPRGLILALLGWFVVTALLAADPASALRRVVMAAMVCVSGNAMLLLPRDEKHFARLIGGGLLALLALCYFGVIFIPRLAIHQSTDVLEPLLAGNWRGVFSPKNTAAAAMAFTCFAGLFVWARWSRIAGALLVVGSLYFLFNTGGKTSLAMVPAVLVVAYVFERVRALRYPLVVGGLALFNLVAVGSAVWPGVRNFVTGLGIDASFTDRVDIWQLAFSAIEKRPLTGYGFSSFWQTGSLVYGGGSVETWAVNAANAHNAYLDAALTAGVPGLVLVVAWLVFVPIRNMARAEQSGNDPLLTRLFVRIWLYGLFASSLESFFFANGGPIWFTILMGVFGLGMQGRSALVTEAQPQWRVANA